MKHRALIIEDSRTQARQLAALLEQEGFEVEVAPDGERGLAACAARPPDAVLCDIVMPGINGFEVCRRLRARPETRDLPVMLMTSLADTADVVRALAAGADNFVTKPFVPATLVARLRRMLSKRRSLDEGGGVEFRGSRFAVPDDRARTLDVLLSSLEAMAERNVELERSRAAAEEALAEARRAVAARDEVIGVVSHDLRGPLNAVLMAAQIAAAELAQMEHERAGSARARLATIVRSAERMGRLVGDLLDVTRIEAGRMVVAPAPESVAALFEEACLAQRPLADTRGVALRAELDDPALRVLADRERAQQVLANLIGNALKFTPAGGEVTLRAAREGAAVQVVVQDTGVGIAAAQLPHVFDRFWQAEGGARQGAGLGLSIVKGLVEAQGGSVTVESELGRGTAVRFTLPACA
jgi:two-component system sensor histidine kinase/response regulator